MPVEKVARSFGTALNSISSALDSDLKCIIHEVDASEAALHKATDPLEMCTTGANLAAFPVESVSQLSVKSVIDMMREASAQASLQQGVPSENANQVGKKAVSFNPKVKSVRFNHEEIPASSTTTVPPRNENVPATPQTVTKVRSMLSVWEEKIQRVTTPHYGKTPASAGIEPVSGIKRKQPEPPADSVPEQPKLGAIAESPAVDASFDGPILEIPDDLLAELEGLEPVQRERRMSELKLEVEERRRSAEQQHQQAAIREPVTEEQAPALTGRVAAALKLFTGTSVPKRDFGVVSFAPSKVYNTKAPTGVVISEYMAIDIDGEAIEDHNQNATGEPIKFYDAREKGVVDVEFEEDSESDANNDPEVSQLHAAEAAKEVAEEEAAVEELEKSVWLADIEEIKVVSTPAKGGKSEVNADWSAVSQRMNLSCHLTPVVPGRRSCVVVKPKMVPLGPKDVSDQYDITDKDTDSESELSPASRAKKHIPPWCVNWRQKAIAQIAVDPESIFGVTVPKCDLDVIFTQKNYRDMGLSRPKRVRGSSGNWTFDKLTQDEVDRYRAKLGQVVKADGVFVG